MFGLMKARVCSQPAELRQHRRLHYCGTCKTIGRQYSQRSRVLLNNDAVFLAELLSALSGEDRKLEKWSSGYQSYNCMSLPGADEAPISLQFAAAAALISAEFKVADALVDSGLFKWKAASRIFSSDFRAASDRLTAWRVPLDLLWRCSNEQQLVEEAAIKDRSCQEPLELLERLSAPTAQATAILFEHGARVAGREDAQEAMKMLGHAFGTIVYLLDAVEDYEKDRREGDFNAIQASFGLSSNSIPGEVRSLVKREIERLCESFDVQLDRLAVARSLADRFSIRLKANLSRRLGIDLPIAACACKPLEREATPERWRSAAMLARRITKSPTDGASLTIARVLRAPFVFVAVFVIALIFPRQAAEATSFRECVDIIFNLMFIGSVLRPIFGAASNGPPGGGPGSGPDSVFPPGYTPPPQSAGGPNHPAGQQPGKESKKGSGGCGVCCCDCGDCCDCADCCSGCDCC